MKRCPKAAFTGVLAQPISWQGPIIGWDAEENADAFRAAAVKLGLSRRMKLELLKQHYEIHRDPTAFVDETDSELAMRLAIEFVPGFALAPLGRRGRSRSWTDGKYIGLLVDLDVAKEKFGIDSDAEALRNIVSRKNEYYRDVSINTVTLAKRGASLNARLTEARNLVSKKELEFMFKADNQALLRQVFGPGSSERKNSFLT